MARRDEGGVMLIKDIEDPTATEPADLHRQYLVRLATAIEEVGLDHVAERTGIQADRLEALPDTDPGLTVGEAADILAASGAVDSGTGLRQEVRDDLLLGMSSAVVDVDDLAAALPGEYGPRDYQQMIEGGMSMPLEEYARISLHIERENPF